MEDTIRFRVYPEIRVMTRDGEAKVDGIAFKEFLIHREAYDAIVKSTEINTCKRIEKHITNQFGNYGWVHMIVDYVSFLRSKIERGEK